MAHSHENEHKETCQNHSHGCSCCCEGHCHDHVEEEEMSWWKPALSLALLLAGIIMSAMGVQWFQNRWVQFAWYAVAWLPTGLGVLREAIEEAREGEIFSEFLLMSVASIGAFAIGEYPEAVAVMALYCIGEALQDRAVSRARGNIQSLIAFRPDHAVVVTRVDLDKDEVEIFDPQSQNESDVYTSEQFLDAWEDSCKYATSQIICSKGIVSTWSCSNICSTSLIGIILRNDSGKLSLISCQNESSSPS